MEGPTEMGQGEVGEGEGNPGWEGRGLNRTEEGEVRDWEGQLRGEKETWERRRANLERETWERGEKPGMEEEEVHLPSERGRATCDRRGRGPTGMGEGCSIIAKVII